MAEIKCTHCGSKYTEYKRTENGFSADGKVYYCQSCKKEFRVGNEKESASGEWLMTLMNDDAYNNKTLYKATFMEVYRRADGMLVINQKHGNKYTTVNRALKIKAERNEYMTGPDNWIISADTYITPNSQNGATMIVKYIEMNNTLKQKALNNEAMRICHDSKNVFHIEKRNAPLVNDVSAWLCDALGLVTPKKGGCYVASCVYGSYDCPEVWTLRRFRDETLAASLFGRTFVRAYYAVSPTLVKWFGETAWFKRLFKGSLDRMVRKLQRKGVSDMPYCDREW
ncbi:MAG: hypothetical protein IIU58_03695 [Clostridia bacterium]|nr:hypothetical protein [Clostridia bacterium]